MDKKVRRILVIRPEKMGDLVVSTPVFRAIKESFPDYGLDLLTDEFSASVVQSDPYLDKIIRIPWSASNPRERASFFDLYGLLHREGPYEKALVLYANHDLWNWVLALNGVREVSQIGGTVSAKLFGHSCVLRNGYTSGKHMSQLFLDVAGRIGAETKNPLPELYVSDSERKAIATKFPFLRSGNNILLHPFSLTATANLSPASYMNLSLELANYSDRNFFLIGTAKEAEAIEIPDHPRISKALLGQLSIRELMAAITHADLVMGGSSGIVHLAAALSTPTLGFYCPHARHDEVWGPLGPFTKTLTVPKEQCHRVGGGCSKCQGNVEGVFCDIAFAFSAEAVAVEIERLTNARRATSTRS
jgi:ADP-heptose:LPS heptosyltransferase